MLKRAKMLKIPFDHSLVGGRFAYVEVENLGQLTRLVLHYQQLQLSSPPILMERNEKPVEKIQGVYIPRFIRFEDVAIKRQEGYFRDPVALKADDPMREIPYALHWRSTEGYRYHLVSLRSDEPSVLLLTAKRVEVGSAKGNSHPFL
jgi:hypothetical protein